MSGLLALLDDVAAIAKVASASVDDVVGQAVKASSKAAGAVVDDAAVTPKYVQGFSPARELPIVWGIARGSLFNKLVILLPVALVLSQFAPWAIAPLLMLGGGYLCFEGVEKIWHALRPSHHAAEAGPDGQMSAAHLEEAKVKGAIKTDFILSAEIMTIILASLPDHMTIWVEAAAMALAGALITVVVYGAVGLIVKADDIGLAMAEKGRLALTRGFGIGIVRAMPKVMTLLLVVGTAAMIWVGGSILVHGAHELGWHLPQEAIRHAAMAVAGAIPVAKGATEWIVTAALDGVVGIAAGSVLVAVTSFAILPLVRLVRRA
ncbi:DUF808 domain-containing protein [Rhodovulum sp. BSW8]|uniref:DUF808 domain-containing protein n=1 Tax=Rhodovulum visakhapatnamense TaxID=364297 RepID=A0A4V3GUE3_9RHOB|nr:MULTISPECIES: DUF808 domain-containing protein [Rhodovulum]OLS46398.1 ABC transporter [Rhodovulum sulfidophilum]MBL3570593.1 DUF808 domain-containing protein [Rhodovulum visakhapatnamense]MBL3577560.1 DUF808 domain-containing protein [Rhodovulum visakhapatnamense]RBO55184.1 DUF808 domain-containing protein [Rhodovulum sp. BSW8]TDX30531.1 hypothetical protein EV657_10614 [Rhodovulum visakhapatnamense]